MLQQFVYTFNEVEENQVSAHVWGSVYVTLTPARVREWLGLPILGSYTEAPSKEDLLDFVIGLGYKKRDVNKIGAIRRSELPAIWQVMMEVLNKCLTSKIGGTDQINQAILTIMFGLINGFKIDYGSEIFNLLKRSIITRNGRITSHLPYPRLISIFISEAFIERNMEIPILEDIWRSKTMKAWSSNHGWESDKDIPVLPESMLCFIAPDSQYRIQHEKLLTKSTSPTEEPSREIVNCSSSTEKGDNEKSSPSENEGVEERRILEKANLEIAKSPENEEKHAESQQIHEAGIHHEFEIHQTHDAGSHIAGETHDVEIEATEVIHHDESYIAGTSLLNTVLVETHREETKSESSVNVSYKIEYRTTNVDQEVTSSINLNSESENEEEDEIPTDGDQETDQGNLAKGNLFTSKTYGGSYIDMIQGHKETQNENEFFITGGDNSGKFKAAPSVLAKNDPIISKTAANVFAAGMLEGTSVVPIIPEKPMNQENIEAILENVYKVCKRNPVEEKLDMLLSEIQGQKADMKTLSESVKEMKKQTEENTEALKSLQKMKEKAPESNISASEIQTILTEIEKIKAQVAKVIESRQSSSTNRVLEEVTILRASNNSITDALEKLSKEWAEIQTKAQTEFTNIQKNIHSNSKQVKEVQQLVEKMQFNIAKLAKVNPQELMKEIPAESSHQEAPKSTPQQSSISPITKAGTTVMGPPPNVPKEEILKRLATAKPQVITNLKLLASVPNPTISDDSAISKYMNKQIMNEWEQEGESATKSKTVKRKISETKSIMVKEIARDVMIFPETNLVSYYLTKEDKAPRSLSPTRLDLREERIKRGPSSIHKQNWNPVKRILNVSEVKSAIDDIGGTHVQNRYTLQRENGEEQKVTDEEIADQLHPLDILFMKDHYEKEKKNNQEVRRALNGISKAGILLFERIAFSDFDLCINFEHVHNKKVYVRSPKTKVPSDIVEDARSGDIIILTNANKEQDYGVIFRDQDENKAMFRSVDICKYSNQTLRYILKTMNKRQEHLQKIEKNMEGSRKEIEQMIEEWIQAREWYKDMYVSCNKYISYKKKLKTGDTHKRVKLN